MRELYLEEVKDVAGGINGSYAPLIPIWEVIIGGLFALGAVGIAGILAAYYSLVS